MPGKGKLDFAIEPSKARQLQNPETRKNIEELFKVQVKLSLSHQDSQWVTVFGPNSRCKLAKVPMIIDSMYLRSILDIYMTNLTRLSLP